MSEPSSPMNSEDERISEVASSGSRKRDHAECDEELYYVETVRKYHNNRKELDKNLKRCFKSPKSPALSHFVSGILLRNRNIVNMLTKTLWLLVIPDNMDPYQRVYFCTHGRKERVRSKGHRSRHNLEGVGCPLRFRPQYAQRNDEECRIETKHNHFLSKKATEHTRLRVSYPVIHGS